MRSEKSKINISKKVLFLLITGLLYFSSLSIWCEELTPVKILTVSPEGGVECKKEVDSIVVTFNQPMVPLAKLPEGDGSGPLIINPPVKGKYRWLGTTTLSFTPKEKLPFGTEFEVIVPAGVTSLSGAKLERDYTWKFQTLRPDLVFSVPYHNAKWVELDHSIFLMFNQEMTPEKAGSHILLKGVGPDKEEYDVKFKVLRFKKDDKKYKEKDYWRWYGYWNYHRLNKNPERVLVIDPEKDLLKDYTYHLTLSAGLLAKEGNLGMRKTRTVIFETYKTFKFIGVYLVGSRYPNFAVKLIFTNPVFYSELVKNISFEPEIEIPEHYKDWHWSTDKISLTLLFKPETEYTITFSSGLKDRFGNFLGKEVKAKFKTGPYASKIYMNQGKGIIEAKTDLRFPVGVVNVEKINKQIDLIKPDEVIPLFLDCDLFHFDKYVNRDYIVDKIWETKTARNKKVLLPLDLKEVLREKKYGLVFVQLSLGNTLPEKAGGWHKVFLQVTNLGISAKFSPDNNLIWVTTLKNAKPVSGAKVEIRGDDNKVYWQGSTDKNGLVETPGWRYLGIKPKDRWSRPRQWAFVYKEEDMAFTASDWGTGIYPYRFGISYEWRPKLREFAGHIYTERGIYRAGEEVFIKGIIREKRKGKWIISSVKKLKLHITDSRGEEIVNEKVELNDFGSFSYILKLNKNAPSGRYQINLRNIEEKKEEKGLRKGWELEQGEIEKRMINIYGSFLVEAYRVSDFEVRVWMSQDSYIFGDEFEGELFGWYLFGAPMKEAKVSWRLRLNPGYFKPEGYRGFVFGPSYRLDGYTRRDTSKLISSGKTRLDKNGKLKVKAKLDGTSIIGSMNLLLEGTVTSETRQSISGRKQVVVHRGEFYIGLKPEKTFADTGKDFSIKTIVVDPEGKFIPEQEIEINIVKREWHSVRKAGVQGRYFWVVEEKDIVQKTYKIKSESKPKKIIFKPLKPGFYIIHARGKDKRGNKISTDTYFYVIGKGYVPWARTDDDRIELVSDKTKYKPGERAKILVKSPYEKALALITMEREGIIDRWTKKLVGSAPTIDLPITLDHLPNVYVSVILIQGRVGEEMFSKEGEDIGKPSFKIGYINLPVDPGDKRLNIEVKTDREEYRPQDEVRVNFKVTDANGKGVISEVSVAVVDLGVLNLINYKTPNSFNHFYGARPLSVQTAETRIHIIGQRHYGEKGENPGGGVGLLRSELAGIDLRALFKATAFWEASIKTTPDGKGEVKFRLPDNLTSFRVMVTGQTKDACFGAGETKFIVTKKLILKPALPRFARLNDSFEAGVLVCNNSQRKGDITLITDAQGIELKGEKIRKFSLAPGKEKEVKFSYFVNQMGKATFMFRAKMGDETDGLKISIPIKLTRPTEAVALYSQTTDKAKEGIIIPEDIYPGVGKLEFTTSSSALVGLEEGINYLWDYPYYCIEQVISRVLPFIIAYDLIKAFDLSELRGKNLKKVVREQLEKIIECQLPCGGFTFWPGGYIPSEYCSAYAMYCLAMAKNAGYKIDKKVIEKGIKYLRAVLRYKDVDWNYPYSVHCQLTTKSFVVYALSLFNIHEPAYIQQLFDKRDQITLFGRALLLKAIHNGQMDIEMENEIIRSLINKMKVSPTTVHFEEGEDRGMDWIFHSNVRSTALILQAILEVKNDLPQAEKMMRWLVQERKKGRWRTTQENFYVFHAFYEYFRIYEKEEPDFTAFIFLEEKEIIKEIFKKRELTIRRKELSLDKLKKEILLPINIQKKGDGRLYYGVRMIYAPKGILKPRDEGILVLKTIEIIEDEGKKVPRNDIYPAGKKLLVTLRIITPQERLYVVVDDPLPAGFEAINVNLDTESQEDLRRLRKIRSKQKRYWWGTFNHSEIYDDRVCVFADSLQAGEHIFTYLVRTVTYGRFSMPATKAEEMYNPEVFGRNEQKIIRIEK